MDTIQEAAREVPVVQACDVCVIGGSCTGVFAAVRAARLGASVALVEHNGYFGGAATAGLVNIWHAMHDTTGTRQIIAGLTQEMIDRLGRWGAVESYMTDGVQFNPAALTLELDALVREHAAIRPYLHTSCVSPVLEDGRLTHAVIEDKTGRRAIQARYFIDATGDGDLVARMGLPTLTREQLQPPTQSVLLAGLPAVEAQYPGFNLGKAAFDPRFPQALPPGFLWWSGYPGVPGVRMVAGTRVHGANCADADELTHAEMEGRRQVRAMIDILHEHFPGGKAVMPVALPAYIGIRETRHAVCRYQLTEDDVLGGKRFPDAIANGTYRVDIHPATSSGVIFRYLNGEEWRLEPGVAPEKGRWRPAQAEDPTCYQIPYRSLVPHGATNVLVAGRLLDADPGAFGAARVMVNTNQTGEAAGVACALACRDDRAVGEVDPALLRQTLAEGGSAVV
ncbi:MAG: FAD-dependent oxidoreductase [Armatimonadota bacterium]